MNTLGSTRPTATQTVFLAVVTLAVAWLIFGMAVGMFVLGYRVVR